MKRVRQLGIIMLVFLLVAGIVKSYDHVAAKDKRSNATSSAQKTSSAAIAGLTAAIDNSIASDPDGLSAAVSIIDLNTGNEYQAGATDTVYKAASTAKVLAAVDYLHETEIGQASLSQQIDGTPAQQLIKQMIEVSDDNAWADINDYLGSEQQSYAQSIGLTSFTGDEYNTMTASDMAKLLAMLDEGRLLNATHSNLLLSYMANTTSTNLIQAVLPPDATVYHKYGQVWGYLNDAAIVDYQGHRYVLVIYTNNQDGTADEYDDQVDLIHQISQMVFQAFVQ